MSLERLILTSMVVPLYDPTSPNCRWGLPLILWGDIGIGKSERIETAATFLNLLCETILPSTCAPEDFSGIPMGDGKGGGQRVCMMKGVREICDIKEGVVFID